MKLTDDQIETIMDRAHASYRGYRRGIRGQSITKEDCVEYWAIIETAKFIRKQSELLTNETPIQ